jgi:hypothetical protein
MRAQDLIRAVLDLLDNDTKEQETVVVDMTPDAHEPENEMSRFKQIFHLLSQRNKTAPYSNSPRDAVADLDAVLMGGGVNGPKHPADIRVKDPGVYQ